MRIGIGIGIGKKIIGIVLTPIQLIVSAFKIRVLADSGVFEGEANLLNQNANTINDTSLAFISSSYKANKVYSLKPIDGSGDLVFSRGSFGYRNNSSNLIEFVSSAIPRINYVNNIPTLLGEPIRTQLILNSADVVNASWSKVRVTATNTSNTTPLRDITARKLEVNNGGVLRCSSNILTGLTAGTRYTYKQYIKRDNLDLVSVLISDQGEVNPSTITYNFATNTLGGDGTGIRYLVDRTATILTDGWVLITIALIIPVGETTIKVNSFLPCSASFVGVVGNAIQVSNSQLEVGQFSTSDMVTGGSTLTRVGDSFVNNNASNFASQGTLFICFRNNRIYNNEGTHSNGFYISNGTQTIYFANINGGRIRIWTQSASTIFQTTADTCKIALTWNGSVLNVWQNGIKVVTNFSFPHTFNRFGSAVPNTPTYIEKMFLYKEIKDDTYCANLTT